jgi:hypothetical protein
VSSSPGDGTHIRAEIPLMAQAPEIGATQLDGHHEIRPLAS